MIATASYLFAFGWGNLILLSLIGWGGILNWILFPEHEVHWGQRGAWGLALSAVTGGVLNLLSWISNQTVLVFLGLGVAAWLVDVTLRRVRPFYGTLHRSSEIYCRKVLPLAGVVLATFLTLVLYAGSVCVVRHDSPQGPAGAVRFNLADDFQAYFVFPEKMVKLGSMGPDPFCTRRLETSLGGQSFLDTFVLCVLPAKNLHIIDPGLGLLLIIGLLLGICHEKGMSPAWSLALLLFFLLMHPPTINISSLYTGTVLFMSLCCTLNWKALRNSRFFARTTIIALLAASTCSLKSSFIPACGIFLVCSFAFYVVGQDFSRQAIAEVTVVALLVIAFLLPWMISMYQSSGTLLFPLLGKGYHRSASSDSLFGYSWLTFSSGAQLLIRQLTEPLFVALTALAVFHVLSRENQVINRQPVLSLAIGAAAGTVAIVLANGDPLNSRYAFPFLLAAVLVLMTEAASPEKRLSQGKFGVYGPVVAGAAALFLVGSAWDSSRALYVECFHAVKQGIAGASVVSDRDMAEYRSLQQSVPSGEAILARLDKTFLLDFKRNPVFLLDYAAVSPPPGMPFAKGSEPLARYLISQSIRYVAYSYGDEDRRTSPLPWMKMDPPTYSPWLRSQLLYTWDFQDNLEELEKTRGRIYDDGKNYVLDLLSPSKISTAR